MAQPMVSMVTTTSTDTAVLSAASLARATKTYVAAGFLLGAWMLGVAGLALSPTAQPSGFGNVTHYRVHSSTNLAYQDASGKFMVHLRNTRPVVGAEFVANPL